MAKVVTQYDQEPGWSNRRASRGEPQSPAVAPAATPTEVSEADAPDPPAPKPKAPKPPKPRTKKR